jgi:hypothetical protein
MRGKRRAEDEEDEEEGGEEGALSGSRETDCFQAHSTFFPFVFFRLLFLFRRGFAATRRDKPAKPKSDKPCRFFQRTGNLSFRSFILLLSPSPFSTVVAGASGSTPFAILSRLTLLFCRSMRPRPHLPLRPRLHPHRHLSPLPPFFLPSKRLNLSTLSHSQRPPLPSLLPLPLVHSRRSLPIRSCRCREGGDGVP